MNRRRRDELPEINSPVEIPKFSSEAAEAEFWDTHALGPGLLSKLERETPLAKAIGPVASGLLGFVPAERLQARADQLKSEISMAEELASAGESRVLRWMRDYHERAPEWILRQLNDLDAQLDRLLAEQDAVVEELLRRPSMAR